MLHNTQFNIFLEYQLIFVYKMDMDIPWKHYS